MKVITKFMAVIGCAILVLLVLFYGYLHFVYYGDNWKQRTTPLPNEKVAQLCTSFGLKKDVSLCSGTKVVYGPDFYEIIRDTFRPYEAYEIPSSDAATYDEVKEKIGMFEYECEPVVYQADGFTYFNCLYDLRGDREFIIGVMYTYPDNAVFRINTPMGFDGE